MTEETAVEQEPTLDNDIRLLQANQTVKSYMLGSMGAGLMPFPLLDVTLVGGIQLKMLHALATLYEQEFSKEIGKSVIGALIGGIVPATATSSMSKLIPGVGTVAGMASMSVLSGASTYALGKVFIQHFESGGTFLNFDPEAVKDYFAEVLEEGKQMASRLKKSEAVATAPEETSETASTPDKAA